MNLINGLTLVFHESKRITRRVWHNPRIFVALEQGQLCIKGYSSSGPDDGKSHPWSVTESDWFADDWEICE